MLHKSFPIIPKKKKKKKSKIAKHSIKTKLHPNLIYNFKMEKSLKISSKIQLVVHLKNKIP